MEYRYGIVKYQDSFSPWILRSQFLFSGEQLDAVLQLEEGLLLRLVLHALVFVKVLFSHRDTHRREHTQHHIILVRTKSRCRKIISSKDCFFFFFQWHEAKPVVLTQVYLRYRRLHPVMSWLEIRYSERMQRVLQKLISRPCRSGLGHVAIFHYMKTFGRLHSVVHSQAVRDVLKVICSLSDSVNV